MVTPRASLNGLNGPQRDAVEQYQGPALIIAGAGSGKTRVLTMRIAHLIEEGVPPRSILALTFTNKAAREMRERMARILPHEALRGLWMGTFHSIFSRILRAEAELLGYPPTFSIYDTADSRNVVKHIVRGLELPDDQYKPNEVFARISMAKNNLVLPEAYAANATLTEEDARAKRPRLAEIYALYCAQCRRSGAMDFDDLLLNTNLLLRDHPAALDKYGELFRYILVDEYQDTNYAQYLIVKKLADRHRNICVVGDDSQSIYSFRGARIENILRFQQDYPDARLFKLEQNYRSTRTIVEAANSVIEKNSRRLPKKLFSENEAGEPIRVFCTYTDKDEATRVAGDIHTTIYCRQASPDQFAILYRTNAQSRILEEQLRNRNIPYRIYGGQSFYQRAEIKDAIAYLRLAVNPRDDESLRRIINFPARGIGETSLEKIVETARAKGLSLWETLCTHTAEELHLRGPAVKSLAAFVETFAQLFERAPQADAWELAMETMERSGILRHYKTSKLIEDESRLQNIEELLNSIHTYVEEHGAGEDSLPDDGESPLDPALAETKTGDSASESGPVTIDRWLQEIALLTDQDADDKDDSPRVTLLTVHAAKGLEFRYTYIVGLEENLFPSQHGTASAEEIEEERRLFYVALTRAEKQATLSFALSRFRWGTVVPSQPSRFIKEIDPKHLDMPDDALSSGEASSDERPNFRGGGAPWSRNAGGSANRPAPRGGGKAAPAPETPPARPPAGFRRVGPTPAIAPGGAPTGSVPGTPLASAEGLAVGAKVEHERFGPGEVTALERTATDTKITVRFEAAGTKVLLLKYAKLRVL